MTFAVCFIWEHEKKEREKGNKKYEEGMKKADEAAKQEGKNNGIKLFLNAFSHPYGWKPNYTISGCRPTVRKSPQGIPYTNIISL